MTDLETLKWYWDNKSTHESPQEASSSLAPKIADTKQKQIACDSHIKSENSPVKECPPAPKKNRIETFRKSALGIVEIAELDLADV